MPITELKPSRSRSSQGCVVLFFGLFTAFSLVSMAFLIQGVMVRQSKGSQIVAFSVVSAFIIIGTGGIYFTLRGRGKSPEALQATYSASGASLLPRVKIGRGQTLDHKLLPDSSAGGRVAALAIFALLWNGLIAVPIYQVVTNWSRGQPSYFLGLFMIPFLLVGILLVGLLVREILIATGVGRTDVEISAFPLRPGRSFEVVFSQHGNLSVNSLQVKLICEERATYRVGTDTRTSTEKVFEEALFSREAFEITRWSPLIEKIPARIPPDAMHSFKSKNNQVVWKIWMEGDIARWPDFERSFTLCVTQMAGEQ